LGARARDGSRSGPIVFPESLSDTARASPRADDRLLSTPLYLVVEETGESAEFVTEHLEDA
jgi:hypothetical protein